MLKRAKFLFPETRTIPAVLIMPVFFVLMGMLAGCDKEMADPTTGPEIAVPLKDEKKSEPGPPQLLVSGLQGSYGSAVGPDGALYVAESLIGRISRIDPKTGEVTTFASGLPPSDFGGAYDLAFLDGTAYVVVILVGPPYDDSDAVIGLYRVDGPESFTVIADIGAFAIANPPDSDFFAPEGVQFAIQTYRGGFLVTDGHHNRVLQITCNGEISVFKAFGNVVPTGLALHGNKVFMAEAGPIPHLPEEGKVVSFGSKSPTVTTLATGAPLLVDVECYRGQSLYALSQGFWDGVAEGDPAEPDTGSLVRVNKDGTFTTITDGLDRPTSLEFIKNIAYIVTLTGEVWTIENVSGPPFGA